MQNLITIYTKTHQITHFSKFSRWGTWLLACVQLISLFLYKNSHFTFRMLSKLMFPKKIPRATTNLIANVLFFIQNMLIFTEFVKTPSDEIYTKLHYIFIIFSGNIIVVDMCGVEGKRRLCDLNVTSSSPALATRHIRCVLLVNNPNKFNLLSWLLIYLCNK